MLVFFRTHFLPGKYIHELRPISDTVTSIVKPIVKSRTTVKKCFLKMNGEKFSQAQTLKD